jgi:ABC-2 type transport system ATP-binding protein
LGGGIIRMSVQDGRFKAVIEQATQLSAVKSITQWDGVIVIETHHAQKALMGVLEIINRLDVRVTFLEILEPNLETVFLQLTGKNLRD